MEGQTGIEGRRTEMDEWMGGNGGKANGPFGCFERCVREGEKAFASLLCEE